MADRPLNTYSILLMHNGKGTNRQIDTLVSAVSQKRAAELLGITPSYLSQWGHLVGHKNIAKLLRENPEQVFLSPTRGTYYRAEEWGDESKKIVVDVSDEEVHGRNFKHPAFGWVEVSRIHGGQNLFMVDYPQDHFLRLTISTAELNKRGATDRVMHDREIINIDLSEVQWARMISSPNGGGAACTLSRYRDPLTGEYLTPTLPDRHVADAQDMVDNVKEKGKKAMEAVTDARAKLAEIMKGGALRKGDLQAVVELLDRASREGSANMAYAVECAQETIETAVESAKAEVDAHVDYAMMRLGERALGERLQQVIAAGASAKDVTAIGRSVAAMLDQPALPPPDTES